MSMQRFNQQRTFSAAKDVTTLSLAQRHKLEVARMPGTRMRTAQSGGDDNVKEGLRFFSGNMAAIRHEILLRTF